MHCPNSYIVHGVQDGSACDASRYGSICDGRMQLIATIDDPSVIRKILAHLGLPTEVPKPRSPPAVDAGWIE